MNFGETLKKIRKNKKMTQDALSVITGIKRSSISQYEIGMYEPDIDNMRKIANALGVPISDLLIEDNSKLITKFIPLIGLASCGIPQEYDLNGYDPIPIDNKLYHDGMYAVQAEGDSMSPKINNSDIVYCSPSSQIENGHIVHYSYNNESGIKRYKINEEGTIVSLIPINTEYDIITIDEFHTNSLSMAKVVGVVDTDF